ncbi:tRNA-guanine transglycosylase [Desulfococcaceae bacterium HSG8]|nr:tRNA-guanine transglycosylase [Desulfococcaceae bacterium HSG8]
MRSIITNEGITYSLPVFLPVFEYGNRFVTTRALKDEFNFTALMTNAYFLYKKRELKNSVIPQGIKSFLDFEGLVVTDSGAFQQFSGPLYLSNKKIIRFQQDIGVDIISPLDIITTPGDNRTTAGKKLDATLKRIREGMKLADRATLIGVQQGGRFSDLRGHALEMLMEIGVKYIALGSLVPFFNKNHDIEFIGKVIKQAREIIAPDIPIHLYGGGDPLELPFYIFMGCDIFDSSSFIHYARGGWYMTPYGAFDVRSGRPESLPYACECTYCKSDDIWSDSRILALHNLGVIRDTMQEARVRLEEDTLADYLDHVTTVHQECFPESRFADSWNILCNE